MAKKSIKKNYIYNVSYQILLLVVPLITTPYVSRVLGADGVGQFSYATSIAAYFVIAATLGTTIYGQREISYHQEDAEGRSVVFYENLILRLLTTLIATVAYCAFLIVTNDRSPLTLVLTLNVINVACDVTWFFQGLEEFGKVVGRNFVFKIINVALIFLCVKTKSDLALYALIMSGTTVLASVSLIPFLREYLVRVKREELHPFKSMPTVLSLFVPTIAIQVYTVLDKTMIGVITQSAAQNGYYEQSQKIANIALTVVTSMGTVMVPRIGSLFASGLKDEVRNAMGRTYRFVWLLAIPLAFGLAAVSDNLVPWFFGKGYDEVALLLKIFSLQIVAIGVNNATGIQYLIPTGQQNLFSMSVVVGAVLNLVMNLLLIPRFMSAGAAVSSVCAESAIAIVQLVWVRDQLDVKGMLKSSVTYIACATGMFAIGAILSQHLTPGPLHTAIIIAACVCFYALCLGLIRDQFFIEMLSLVKSKLSRGDASQ